MISLRRDYREVTNLLFALPILFYLYILETEKNITIFGTKKFSTCVARHSSARGLNLLSETLTKNPWSLAFFLFLFLQFAGPSLWSEGEKSKCAQSSGGLERAKISPSSLLSFLESGSYSAPFPPKISACVPTANLFLSRNRCFSMVLAGWKNTLKDGGRKRRRKGREFCSVVTKRLRRLRRQKLRTRDANDLDPAAFPSPFPFSLSSASSFRRSFASSATRDHHAHVTLVRYSRNQFTCRDLRRWCWANRDLHLCSRCSRVRANRLRPIDFYLRTVYTYRVSIIDSLDINSRKESVLALNFVVKKKFLFPFALYCTRHEGKTFPRNYRSQPNKLRTRAF